ncbi:hypothetical protein PG995_012754 [Apiospora arundinis]
MGLKIHKRGNKSPPTTSHKDFKSLLLRDSLVDRIKKLNRTIKAQQIEIHARYREVAARYQEVLELRWTYLKAQCLEQAQQLFGTHLSHVVYDAVIWGIAGVRDGRGVREEDTTLVVSVHCVNRRARRSYHSDPASFPAAAENTTAISQHPPREQQIYELELLDGCLADALQQRPQWMPRHLVLEIIDWPTSGASHGGNDAAAAAPSRYVSRRRAEVCRGTFDACTAMRKEAQSQPADVAKVSADTAFVYNDDSGEESQDATTAESCCE